LGSFFCLNRRMKGVVCVICPSCGAKVDSGFSFCVKCGSRLDAAQEPDYGKADMGGYHSEEEFPEGRGGFTMSTGTFVIKDRPSSDSASDIYSADELNDSDEVFDFSMYDSSPEEGSTGNAGRMPEPSPAPAQQYDRYAAPAGQYASQGMQQPAYPGAQYQQQPYGQNPQYPGAQPFPGAVQPQLIGYDQNGMPVYSQPQMMYGQPQFIGYDQNGMPVYSQPQMMYGQPQFIGYDQNGTPLYSQPQMAYQQPQFIGYDQNGMPVYSQTMPAGTPMQRYAPPQEQTQQQEQPAPESSEEDFWAFFDEGKDTKSTREAADFFGRTDHPELQDTGRRPSSDLGVRPPEKKGGHYMSDTPMVDASDLAPNDAHKYNRQYMRKTEMVDATDMQQAASGRRKREYMAATEEVDADKLAANERYRSRITMHAAGTADPDQLRPVSPDSGRTPYRSEMMREASRPVDAMPKKKKYVDPTDLVELPEHMKAKKTVKEDKVEIPDLPKVGIE